MGIGFGLAGVGWAVEDLPEDQALGRSRHSGDAPVALGEQAGDFVGGKAVEADLGERAGDAAAHFVEEPIADDADGDIGAAAEHLAGGEGADGVRAGVTGVGGEGGEVMAADEVGGCAAHGVEIEGAWEVPGLAGEEGVHGRGVPDPVTVLLAAGLEAGVEIGGGAGDAKDPDVGWQVGVEGEDQFAGGHAPLFAGDVDVGDQSERMHAGVGAAGTVEGAGAGEDFAEGDLDQFLDALAAFLGLPALVSGALERQDEAQAHGLHAGGLGIQIVPEAWESR